MVGAVAHAKIDTTGTAMAKSLKSACAVSACLRATKWELFSAVSQLADHRKADADLLLQEVRGWLGADEHALAGGLAAKLSEAVDRAIRLLTPPKPTSVPSVQPVVPALPKPPPDPKWKVVQSDGKPRLTEKEVSATAEELLRKLRENPRYRLSIQWTLEEGPQ